MLLEGNLQSVQHLGIFVPDIEKAKQWYTAKLGFKVTYEPSIPTDSGEIKLAFLDLDGLVVELVQLPGADLEEVKTRTHGHIDHFAINATTADKAMREVLARGGELHPEATPNGPETFPLFEQGVEYVFFKGPFNEKVEAAHAFHLAPDRRAATLSGWDHLAVFVTDLDRSREFYRQFGFKEIAYGEKGEGEARVCVSLMHKDGFTLEFVLPPAADHESIRQRKDGIIDHVALDVLDADKAYAELKAAGMQMLHDAPVPVPIFAKGVKYFMIRGPQGEKIEFNEMIA
jgi:lactoylglutathione lyase